MAALKKGIVEKLKNIYLAAKLEARGAKLEHERGLAAILRRTETIRRVRRAESGQSTSAVGRNHGGATASGN